MNSEVIYRSAYVCTKTDMSAVSVDEKRDHEFDGDLGDVYGEDSERETGSGTCFN